MNGVESNVQKHPHVCRQLIFDKVAPRNTEESTVFSASSSRSARQPYGEKRALDPYLTPHIKLQVQRRLPFHMWKVKPKLLEDNIGYYLRHLGGKQRFLNQDTKSTNHTRKHYQMQQKESSLFIRRHHEQSEKGGRLSPIDIFVFIASRVYIQLFSNNFEKGSQLKDWQEMSQGTYFTKEDLHKANKHMKSCSSSLVIMEVQIKTLPCRQYTHTAMGNTDSTKC